MSIPTSGLDLQHALDRSPNSNGCKLAALADIALGTDVPFDLIEPRSLTLNEKSNAKIIKFPPKTNAAATKNPATKQPTLFMVSSDQPKLHSIELKTKSFEATFHVSPKSRKRVQSIGKKTGYKDRKKKSRATSKTKLSPKIVDKSKPKDVYDFEESHDSVEDEIIPMTHTRPSKAEAHSATIDSLKRNETPKKQCDDQEDESSYSDRDDYYNFNSVSGSGTEDQENPIEDDDNSDREPIQTSKNTKPTNNSQKKCLIMGRIFKNAKKNSETTPAESKEKPLPPPPPPPKTSPKNDFDEIFNNLKNKSPTRKEHQQQQQQAAAVTKQSQRVKTPAVDDSKSEHKSNDLIGSQSETIEQTQKAKSRKSREVANLEAEWGMSVEQIKGIIGVGMRKAQRRCTANRQNKLVETWSSDEYEEFHSTKDIIALIQEAEMKAQRSKVRSQKQNAEAKNAAAAAAAEKQENSESSEQNPTKQPSDSKKDKSKDGQRKVKIEVKLEENDAVKRDSDAEDPEDVKSKAKKTSSEKFKSEDESDFDEHWNKKAKRAKIRNRRRTITSREDLIEKKVKVKLKEKSAKKQPPMAKVKSSPSNDKKKSIKEVENANANASIKSNSKTTKDGKPMPRRKRIASEMLYYWSSSSDDEFGRIEADSENEDEDISENHLEQHGWIVGDSHKKLVTLLAHAKGKKIEDCGVKESVHKRK